jgi:hypothetical protein
VKRWIYWHFWQLTGRRRNGKDVLWTECEDEAVVKRSRNKSKKVHRTMKSMLPPFLVIILILTTLATTKSLRGKTYYLLLLTTCSLYSLTVHDESILLLKRNKASASQQQSSPIYRFEITRSKHLFRFALTLNIRSWLTGQHRVTGSDTETEMGTVYIWLDNIINIQHGQTVIYIYKTKTI